jgi:serine/threonine-protein kinase
LDGTQFGRYRLVELLGRGGIGEVWRAFDTTIDRVVALKLLPATFGDDEVFRTRFRREARAAAGLDEPHIVPIHDFGEIDGRLYVTMRLIKGRALQEMLGEGPLAPARAIGIVAQIASALNAAHQVGLVHRGVKPSNILVTDDEFAYLIDFGIARAAGETGLTSTGATIGAWAYMAPERFQSGIADARSDVYALACVLYELLTGQQPFAGTALEQIAAAHMFQPAPRPSELTCGVPAAMDQVIRTGMAKDPAQRYPTTRDLARAALDALTTPMQVPGLPARPAEPAASQVAFPVVASRWSLTWTSILVPLILVLLLVGAGVFAVTQTLRPDPLPPTAAPQWQPYVDCARQFTVSLTSLSPQTAHSDIQRILDGSTGAFHDDFVKTSSDFEQVIVKSNVTSQGTVNGAGLESISGATARVLVASTSKVTNSAGAVQDPRSYRLVVQVEKIGDAYKVSKVEYVQ